MATPTLVQFACSSRVSTARMNAGDVWRLRLPNATQANNCIVLCLTWDDHATVAVADNSGNTYNLIASVADGANRVTSGIYVALNVAAGTRTISVTLSVSGANTFQGAAFEYYNIATSSAADGNNGTNATSATLAAGSITPGTSGDLILHYSYRTGTTKTASFTVGSQANITWALLYADVADGTVVQAGQYNSTSAINPTMTMADSTLANSVAVCLKNATAGSDATRSMRIKSIQHLSQTVGLTPNPFIAQVPVLGNLLVATYSGGSDAYVITAMTDSAGHVWQNTGPLNGITTHEQTQVWWTTVTANANLSVTVTYNGTAAFDSTILWYDIIGADTINPYEWRSVANGTQSSNASLSAPAPLQTRTPGGIMLFLVQQNTNTVSGCTGGPLFDSNEFDDQPVGADNNDQDGGWAHYDVPDKTPVPITWTWQLGSSINTWAAEIVSFTPPQGSTLGRPTQDSHRPGPFKPGIAR